MLYIHCGLHKTGSTAIQQTLQRDSKPEINYEHSGYWNLRQKIINEKWASSIIKSAAQNNLIISSESTLGSMANVYDDAAEKINSIKSLFKDLDYCLIIYFRPHLPWLESVYTQLIHQGESLSPLDFISNVADRPYLNFTKLAELLIDTFDSQRLILRRYPGGSCAVKDFYSVLNITPPQFEAPRTNPSLSPARLSIMRELNKISSQQESRQFRKLLQREIEPLHTSIKTSPFPEDIQISIQQRFENDWESLKPYLQNSSVESEKQTRPFRYAGSSVHNPEVVNEALHVIRQVSINQRPSYVNSTLFRRVLRKLKSDPLDLVPSITKHVRKRIFKQ